MLCIQPQAGFSEGDQKFKNDHRRRRKSRQMGHHSALDIKRQ